MTFFLDSNNFITYGSRSTTSSNSELISVNWVSNWTSCSLNCNWAFLALDIPWSNCSIDGVSNPINPVIDKPTSIYHSNTQQRCNNKIEITPSAKVSLVGLPKQSSESCKRLPAVVCDEFDASWVVESLFFASDEDEDDVFVGDNVAIL